MAQLDFALLFLGAIVHALGMNITVNHWKIPETVSVGAALSMCLLSVLWPIYWIGLLVSAPAQRLLPMPAKMSFYE